MTTPRIETIEDLQALVCAGFDDWKSLGDVNVVRDGKLLLFNYRHPVEWNAFERMSRGLILHAETGALIARPFDKFFNWGEGGRRTDAPLDYAMEKMDGSMITVWRDANGVVHTASRGAFHSPQARWAREWVETFTKPHAIPYGLTLICEAVYPANRNIIDYGDIEELYLLAARRDDGSYYNLAELRQLAHATYLSLPWIRPRFETDPDVLAEKARILPVMHEGYVGVFADGSRFKFKSDAYVELHRLVWGLTWNTARECVRDGLVDEVRRVVPEELRVQFDTWVTEIETRAAELRHQVEFVMDEAAVAGIDHDRKTFALWATAKYPGLKPYLFAALDGKPLEPLIFKLGVKDYAR